VETAVATCDNGPAPAHCLTSSFEKCGPNAVGFGWFHGRAVQRIIGDGGVTNYGNQDSGHDSGPNQTPGDFLFLTGPNGGAANGSYCADPDFVNPRWDGCILNFTESPVGCGGPNYGVLDFVIAGVEPAAPNVARMAVLSVDWNEFFAAYVMDSAGAPVVDGDPCGGDGLSTNPNPVNCTPIPVPVITEVSHTLSGANLQLAIGSTAGIPILDDCLIAEDKATNCPRNLYAGRVLMYKHGACTPGASDGFDRRVWVYQASPASGTLNVFPNWLVFSIEDSNLNGALDAGEDGSHGGTVNGVLDPFIIPGMDLTNASVFVPAVPGASDCIYLALGIGLDNNHLPVDPPANTILGEMVISPEVSVSPTPIFPGAATPVGDLITTIQAGRRQGKGTVDWETGIELTTAGFNVIGTKHNGAEVKLNRSLIAAKEGTTGRGASYSATFDAGQLKGSTAVFVEIVKTDGSRERFGPAGF
jgi:hypothetical protein